MSDFKNKINKDPKVRNTLIIMGVVSIFALGVGIFFAQKNDNKNIASSAYITETPNDIKQSIGTSTSALYNKKIEENNQKEANKALEEDKTYIPTPSNKGAFNNASPIDELDAQIKAQQAQIISEKVLEEPKEELVIPPVVEPPAPPPQPVVVAPPPPPVKIIKAKKFGTDEDYMLLAAVSENWKVKQVDSEFNFAGQGSPKEENTNFNNYTNNQNIEKVSQKGKLINKAGTIYNAILETGINSDEPSPVLAKIVSGPLKGTRLIGQMNLSGEKVVVEFTTASIPNFSESIGIDAIAVDPNTSRTSLASDVDRHYFLKYGVLLGATFLSGYAEALTENNQICTVNRDGNLVCQNSNNGGKTSTKDLNRKALGAVGRELADSTKSQFGNIRPTITVDAGSAIGVLLMQDLFEEK